MDEAVVSFMCQWFAYCNLFGVSDNISWPLDSLHKANCVINSFYRFHNCAADTLYLIDKLSLKTAKNIGTRVLR